MDTWSEAKRKDVNVEEAGGEYHEVPAPFCTLAVLINIELFAPKHRDEDFTNHMEQSEYDDEDECSPV